MTLVTQIASPRAIRGGIADRRNIGLVGFRRAALEHRGARDKGIGARSRKLAGHIGTDAAIHLDVDRASGGHRPEVADLADRRLDEGLAAEAGIDRHDQHEVDQVDDIFDRAHRRAGIEHHAGLLAQRADRLQRPMQMRAGLGMDGDLVAAGLGEGFEIGIAWRDHQMGVEDLPGVRAHRLDDVGAVGNVGNEMSVHHVEMDPVGASCVDSANLFAEPGEIRRQNRRGDDDGT